MHDLGHASRRPKGFTPQVTNSAIPGIGSQSYSSAQLSPEECSPTRSRPVTYVDRVSGWTNVSASTLLQEVYVFVLACDEQNTATLLHLIDVSWTLVGKLTKRAGESLSQNRSCSFEAG